MTGKTKAGWTMERRNDWGYPVAVRATRYSDEWVRGVCLRLVLATAMALGLALIPSVGQRVEAQAEAVQPATASDPYAEMSDAERMAGVVLEPEGE